MFHQQNVPAKWKYLWEKFVCCIYNAPPEFENVPASGAVRHFAQVYDYTFVFEDDGIKYLENGIIKPTNVTLGGFAWAVLNAGRIWFGGAPDAGLWSSSLEDPFTITQSNITAGTFTAGGGGSATGFSGSSSNPVFFLSSNGGYYLNLSGDPTVVYKSTFLTADYRNGISPEGYTFGSTARKGIYLINSATNVTSGDFFACHRLTDNNILIFGGIGGSAGIWRASGYPPGSSLTLIDAGILCYHAVRHSDGSVYLCTADGIKIYSGGALSDAGMSGKSFFHGVMGEDGLLYFCGEDGIYFLDYDGQIKFTGKSGNFTECISANDFRLYFTDDSGALIRLVSDSRGNTGYAAATGLKFVKTRYSGIAESAEYSALNDVSPQISMEEFRRMSKSEIDSRIASLWNTATKPDGLSLNGGYFTEDPVSCEIGNFGFKTKTIGGFFYKYRNSPPNNNPDSGYLYRYTGAMMDDGYSSGYWHFIVLYIDNVSFWKERNSGILLSGSWLVNNIPAKLAFIDYPPEEWDLNTVNGQPSTIAFDTARAKALAAPHAASFLTGLPATDISGIYESDTAKTLVLFSASAPVRRIWLSGASITVNGEPLKWSMYVLQVFEWSDRVAGNAGNMAKTLTMEQAVILKTSVFSILDAFGTEPAIMESDYLQMTAEEIRRRAAALIEHAAAGEKYRENNSVIS
jgi:hypothetical protein